jgi:hypothetical protein
VAVRCRNNATCLDTAASRSELAPHSTYVVQPAVGLLDTCRVDLQIVVA